MKLTKDQAQALYNKGYAVDVYDQGGWQRCNLCAPAHHLRENCNVFRKAAENLDTVNIPRRESSNYGPIPHKLAAELAIEFSKSEINKQDRLKVSRDIKFRAWYKDSEEMITEQDCDTVFSFDDDFNIVVKIFNPGDGYTPERGEFNEPSWDEIDCELMQYTGLLDKAGVEVYEGDILTGVTADSEYAIISFEGARFIARTENGDCIHHYLPELCKHSIIVGNIYENLELLKGE